MENSSNLKRNYNLKNLFQFISNKKYSDHFIQICDKSMINKRKRIMLKNKTEKKVANRVHSE